jgi:CobQ-like glutamine amidotransferase family enzyme
MIKLYSFEPFYFNNNGDQGNLDVVKNQLQKQNIKFKIVASPADADFVLIGDCSEAVLNHYEKQLTKLRKLIAIRYEKGLPTLLVGSAYTFFAPNLGISQEPTKRESKFVTTPDGYFGYRNSDNNLPICTVKGAFIASSLFGPLLAKNPQLLGVVLEKLGAKIVLPAQVTSLIETIRSQFG